MTTNDAAPTGPTAPAPRRRRGRAILIALAIVATLVAAFALRVAWIGGVFKSIKPHFDGRCRLVDGPVGAEDLTINQRTGRAYLSGYDRRATAHGAPVPGAIWSYDLTSSEALAVNLTPDADLYFQPHGISLWVEPDGREVLFVVNHPAPGHDWPQNTIEIFDVAGESLVHRATLTDPRLVMPNDLVAVGLDRFYVTNTHKHGPGRMQTLETYLQLSRAQVLRYGPGGFSTAIGHMLFPNGINASRDGRTVYVASTTGRRVQVYDRDPATDALTYRSEIPLGSGADNIEIDADGDLWIGSHPKMLGMAAYAADPAARAPAQVLRVSADGKTVDEVYLSDGRDLAAASVGARYGNRLLIGQIFGNGFLDCEMEERKSVTGDQ